MNFNELQDELLSISSSNSLSVSDETELRPQPKKRAKKVVRRKAIYSTKLAHVPKRTFQHIQRRLKRNKPIIDVKIQTLEKSNCNRFIMNQIKGNKMETVSPESITRLIWEMRERLQKKEYGDLARLISTFTEMPVGKMRWYPTLIKYCLIALMYDPLVQGTDFMDMFLDGVIGCRSDADKKEFLQDINRLPTNIHVTKYDKLWSDYPLPNQLDHKTVVKLCEILNNRIDIKPIVDDENDESDGNSECKTYDENSSNDENETTTEAEKVCDFNALMNRLQKNISK